MGFYDKAALNVSSRLTHIPRGRQNDATNETQVNGLL